MVAAISTAGRGSAAGAAFLAGARPPFGTTSSRASPAANSASCSAGTLRRNSATRISTSWARSSGWLTGDSSHSGSRDELAGELLQLVPQILHGAGGFGREHHRDIAESGVGDGRLVLPDRLPEDGDLDACQPFHALPLRIQHA